MPPTTHAGTIGPALVIQSLQTLEVGSFTEVIQYPLVLTTEIGPPMDTGQIIVATWEDDLVAQIALQTVPTTRTTIYTVPVDRNAILRFIDFINTAGTATVVDLWINGFKIVSSRSIPSNENYSREGIWDLGPGHIIEVQASQADCNLSISGVLELTS